jgi:Collagen triple helix repeat (20 copies)
MNRFILISLTLLSFISADASQCSNRFLMGPTGPQGPRGPHGPTGDMGDPGIAGRNGRHGIQGVPGPQGFQGCTGSRGPIGCTGDFGPDGPRGPTGAIGPTGVTGFTGDTGVCFCPAAVYAVYSNFTTTTSIPDTQITLGSHMPVQQSSGWLTDSNGIVQIPEDGYYDITWILDLLETDINTPTVVELRLQSAGTSGFASLGNTRIGIIPLMHNQTRHLVGTAILELNAGDQIALYNVSAHSFTLTGNSSKYPRSAYTLKLIKIDELTD